MTVRCVIMAARPIVFMKLAANVEFDVILDECPELNVDQAEPDIEESTEPADKGIKYLPKVEEEPAEVQGKSYNLCCINCWLFLH